MDGHARIHHPFPGKSKGEIDWGERAERTCVADDDVLEEVGVRHLLCSAAGNSRWGSGDLLVRLCEAVREKGGFVCGGFGFFFFLPGREGRRSRRGYVNGEIADEWGGLVDLVRHRSRVGYRYFKI